MAGGRDEGCCHVRCEAALIRSTRYGAVMLTLRTEANAATVAAESCVITVVITTLNAATIKLAYLNCISLAPESEIIIKIIIINNVNNNNIYN